MMQTVTGILIFYLVILSGQLLLPGSVSANPKLTGHEIMEQVIKRHELFPYVYEEQTIILTDSTGDKDVRKVRRFSRIEQDKTIKYLMVIDYPLEVRGVALRMIRPHKGTSESGIYLPAIGKELKSGNANYSGNQFLGTDFALEDLAEMIFDFRYIRKSDKKLKKINHFVVEAFPEKSKLNKNASYSMRRHFIRQDIFFIVRTDYFNHNGRLIKRLTHHDLKKLDKQMWRASMILMENEKLQHTTLIKIDQRIFSSDYVPAEIFTAAWLKENKHIKGVKSLLSGDQTAPLKENLNQKPDNHSNDNLNRE